MNDREHAGEPLAAIDIGSNSIKMTIAHVTPRGAVDEVAWASETVRLGAGLDRTGELAPDRIAAALAALTRFAALARDHRASSIVAVATEATRSAANGAAFLARVRDELGIDVRVVDGLEEAALTFRGLAATGDVAGRVVVADIGGGSTEVINAADGALLAARSLPFGSGRLTDRLVAHDPPTAAELADCRAAAAAALATLQPTFDLPTGPDLRLALVGGTGEYLARLIADPDSITAGSIETVLGELGRTPALQLADRLVIAEARARVLPAGVAIVAAFVDACAPDRIEVVRGGLRVGMLLAEAERAAYGAPVTAADPR